MKKTRVFICAFVVLFMISGCTKAKNTEEYNNSQEEAVQPTKDSDNGDGDNNIIPENTESPKENTSANTSVDNLIDYFPFQSDVEYIYEGTGNEYASYRVSTDYFNEEKNRIQIRTNNGGTEMVKVIEISDGKITVIQSLEEAYYRDNLLDSAVGKDKVEILLMEPLVTGTEWTLSDGSKRSISGTEVEIETPSGAYKAIEVTTKSKDSLYLSYYAPKVGLVKTVFQSGETTVSSTLSQINKNIPLTQLVEFYYPDNNEKIYRENKTLTFHTNDITRFVFEKALKEKPSKETYIPLIGANTKINSLYKGSDQIVYVDFSKEFITEMNAGAGNENLILQSITNILGNYYGLQEVYITIDGKPYESGHIYLKKGETFKVNMDSVVR